MRKLLITSICICFCLIRVFAQDSDTLMFKAKTLIEQNRSEDAALIYESILTKDSTNYESLAFLGNFYFLTGKTALDKTDAAFLALSEPSSMQTAHYHDELKKIYYTYYIKADNYLLKALDLKRNNHLEKLVVTIQTFKEKIVPDSAFGRKKK